jgi:hypothetical protein
MSGLARATLAATPTKLQRRVSPYTLLLSHRCPLGARPRQVCHIKHARQAVRVGASYSRNYTEEEREKYLKSVGVKKDKLTSTMIRLRRWAFLSSLFTFDNTFETVSYFTRGFEGE